MSPETQIPHRGRTPNRTLAEIPPQLGPWYRSKDPPKRKPPEPVSEQVDPKHSGIPERRVRVYDTDGKGHRTDRTCRVSRVPADGTEGRLTAVRHAAVETGDTDGARDVLGDGHPDGTVTMVKTREALMLDRVDLFERRKELFQEPFLCESL